MFPVISRALWRSLWFAKSEARIQRKIKTQPVFLYQRPVHFFGRFRAERWSDNIFWDVLCILVNIYKNVFVQIVDCLNYEVTIIAAAEDSVSRFSTGKRYLKILRVSFVLMEMIVCLIWTKSVASKIICWSIKLRFCVELLICVWWLVKKLQSGLIESAEIIRISFLSSQG